MKALLSNWFLSSWTWAQPMGYDVYDPRLAGEIDSRYQLTHKRQHDSHVQAWHKLRDKKASAVLDLLYEQRTTKDWDK